MKPVTEYNKAAVLHCRMVLQNTQRIQGGTSGVELNGAGLMIGFGPCAGAGCTDLGAGLGAAGRGVTFVPGILIGACPVKAGFLPLKPVAITVTRISSSSFSSMTAPKIILASGSTASVMMFEASVTSNRDRSLPPVILNSRALDGRFRSCHRAVFTFGGTNTH